MERDARGVTTVEALLGLILLTSSLMVASVTASAALRQLRGSRYADRIAGLALGTAAELGWLARTAGGCRAMSVGSRSNPDGTSLAWSLQAVPGGATFSLVARGPVASGHPPDSLRGFVPCR